MTPNQTDRAELVKLLDDLVYHGRVIERYEHPEFKPLSEQNFKTYDESRRQIAAIKNRIAAITAQQGADTVAEPVAWRWRFSDGDEDDTKWRYTEGPNCPTFRSECDTEPLYAAPSSEAVARSEVVVPREPSIGRLVSMAIRSDHGLGCHGYYDLLPFQQGGHAKRFESAIRDMRQLYEEATGQGFYRPEREAEYAAMIAAAPTSAKDKP